jgi:crotonobetainyl-CoA:carnitine CoA-transferase CaiB-like acyl-CoA transferase
MTDSVLPFIALPFAEYQAKGASHTRGQFQLSGGQANYNIYQCSDGKYVALGALEPKFWNAVCARLNKPEWQAMITGGKKIQDRVKQDLQEIFLQKPREEWLDFFATDDICLTPVNELEEIAEDKYLNERKLFVDFQLNDTEIKTIAHPVKFASTGVAHDWIAPKLGEDSYGILKSLGKTDETIQELIKENIILTA